MKIDYAELEWTSAGAPRSASYGDIFHDADDPLGESRHVFLEANRIAARLDRSGEEFVIAEAGFGIGLNLLQTIQLWLDAGRPCPLRYLGFEKHPLRPADLERSLVRFPQLKAPAKLLLADYPPAASGCHRLHILDGLQVDLYWGDAAGQLRGHGDGLRHGVHAWYLDGFSPDRNPGMWTQELFDLIAQCSHPEASISTYSAAGTVRRGLQRAGFAVERVAGFADKRHMLTGILQANRPPGRADGSETPWFHSPRVDRGNQTAAVIGAGIAGSSTAWHLARKGWKVTVYEQADSLEHGVNALGQLALRCRLFRQDNPLARFFLQGFLYSAREFSRLARDAGLGWHQCGLVQMDNARNKRHPPGPSVLESLYPGEVLHWQSREQLQTLTGLPLARAGWHSPAAGWLDPLALCHTWLMHPAVRFNPGIAVDELVREGDGWSLRSDGKELSAQTFPVVVIACGMGAMRFRQVSGLPLKSVPGEVFRILENSASTSIRQIIKGERGIFPAADGRHCISASFEKDDGEEMESAGDHIALAQALFNPPLPLEAECIDRSRAVRCQCEDFAPIVGAAPDFAECRQLYAPLARNARAADMPAPAYLPGLFVNLAHGSHGLSSAPLAAEFLASLINGECPPLGQEMTEAVNPLRFLTRRLRRQQVY